jgi:hypothetical protein
LGTLLHTFERDLALSGESLRIGLKVLESVKSKYDIVVEDLDTDKVVVFFGIKQPFNVVR